MGEGPDFSPYRPLESTVRGPFCADGECEVHPDLLPLSLEVTEVYGTSATVREGERYVVRGTYRLSGEARFVLSLAVFTKAFGAGAHVQPGDGEFDLSTEVLALAPDAPNALGIVVGNRRTGWQEIVRWVMLKNGTAR